MKKTLLIATLFIALFTAKAQQPANQNFDTQPAGNLSGSSVTISGVKYSVVSPTSTAYQTFQGTTAALLSIVKTGTTASADWLSRAGTMMGLNINEGGFSGGTLVSGPGGDYAGGNTDVRLASDNGSVFKIKSFYIDVLYSNTDPDGFNAPITITGYRANSIVATIVLNDLQNNYLVGAPLNTANFVTEGSGGTLTFSGANWGTIDEIRFTCAYITPFVLDDIVFDAPTVLPVSLAAFTAKAQNNSALLQWKTASEQSNQQFIVYRKGDNGDFAPIGTKAGAGTYATGNSYTFTDRSPLHGNNYYKLTQRDYNGTETEVAQAHLAFNLSGTVASFSPNPTKGQLNVNFAPGKYSKLSVFNSTGKAVKTIKVSKEASGASVDLAHAPVGVYTVQLSGTNGNETNKVVKQ